MPWHGLRRKPRGTTACKHPVPTDAPDPARLTAPTIPTRYRTLHYDRNEPKGFLGTAARFDEPLNDLPGPGYYHGDAAPDASHPSWSKKGTAAFPSRVRGSSGSPG